MSQITLDNPERGREWEGGIQEGGERSRRKRLETFWALIDWSNIQDGAERRLQEKGGKREEQRDCLISAQTV